MAMSTMLAILGLMMMFAGLWLFVLITERSSHRPTLEVVSRATVAALLMFGGTVLAVVASAEKFAVGPVWAV
jgi:glucose dehydrogenase